MDYMHFLKRKAPDLMNFTAEFYQTFKEVIPKLLKIFQETEREGSPPNSFHEANIHSLQNPIKMQ
jgi:hypothetical protein